MANRLSTIATRTGDDGTTGLADGTRLAKDSARVRAMGEVDELNSCIGVLRAERLPAGVDARLAEIQNDLFDLGAELAIPGSALVLEGHVLALDQMLAEFNASLPRLEEFILPGGTRAASLAHVCRCVCRRAERSVVELGHADTVGAGARQYLNRLSDLLFVLARTVQRADGEAEPQWRQRQRPGSQPG
jgi:cob(I)alamin adenosyltransferase